MENTKTQLQYYHDISNECKNTVISIMDCKETNEAIVQKCMSIFNLCCCLNLQYKTPFHKYIQSIVKSLCFMSVDTKHKKEVLNSLIMLNDRMTGLILKHEDNPFLSEEDVVIFHASIKNDDD
jgi:hypothetical protein